MPSHTNLTKLTWFFYLQEIFKHAIVILVATIKGGIILPTNKKEEIIFTLLMCSLMVFGMSTYNLFLHDHLTTSELIQGFFPGFVTALILDVFVIGGLAKKITFTWIKPQGPLSTVLSISSLMVIGMVTCMSLFGIVMEGQVSFPLYLHTWAFNLIAALPLQLLIVGPFSRKILKTVQTV